MELGRFLHVGKKQSRSNMSKGCDESITDSHESEPSAQHQWLCPTQQRRGVTASSPRPHFTKSRKSSRKFGTWNYLSLKRQTSLNMSLSWEACPDKPLITRCHHVYSSWKLCDYWFFFSYTNQPTNHPSFSISANLKHGIRTILTNRKSDNLPLICWSVNYYAFI